MFHTSTVSSKPISEFKESMVIKEITPEIYKRAAAKADEDIRNAQMMGLISRFQTNERNNKIDGNIGEFLFEEWLKGKEIEYKSDYRTGGSDDFDFKVKTQLKPIWKTIDVKTGRFKTDPKKWMDDLNFKLSVDQKEQHPSDYYFFIALFEDKAYFCGFMSDNCVGFMPVKKHYKVGNMNYLIYVTYLSEPMGIVRICKGFKERAIKDEY